MIKNEIGNVHGRLTVIAHVGSSKGKAKWACRCSCGNIKVVSGDSLRRKTIQSCGCLQMEFMRNNSATHRLTKTRTYRSWQEMKARCYNIKSISYPNYGGRGISVCEQWMQFENFLNDMGIRPAKTFLERIDNAKNYSPENCVWATRIEQNRNRRNNVKIEYNGKTQCLSAWCEELKLPYPRIYYRVSVKHWLINKAFETPFVEHKDRFK